ncbi:hypothetical protein GI482_09510 [Bacillus sp. N3536]|nr:hypothetical protein GI482_09510 [Bacillus sp. N3536]
MELNEKIHNYRFEENEYECLNVELFTNSNGFLLDVKEWTIKNDWSLSTLDNDFKENFLASLEKFQPYLVIAENSNTGNLITISQTTSEIYELEHEITERVEKYFVNSSLDSWFSCLKCFKKYWLLIIETENEEKLKCIFNELKDKLMNLDERVQINEDNYNRQFWNSLYHDNLNFFIERLREK